MGRAFEYRKARKLKRWGHMARTFTKIGKEIELAVIAGGPDPSSNLRLRLLMATAKSESMPKENVERAIKRATEKDKSAYKEGIDMDELELELIDYDIDEVFRDEDEIMIYADFKNYGPISKYLEDHGFEIKSFKFERIPLSMRELSPEEQEDVNGLIERLENDDDVVNVFHNMA